MDESPNLRDDISRAKIAECPDGQLGCCYALSVVMAASLFMLTSVRQRGHTFSTNKMSLLR